MTDTTWDAVDEPVLRWVQSLPPSMETSELFDLHAARGSSPIEGLEPGEVDAALQRLVGYGFVAANSDDFGLWWRLRLAPAGLRYFGEWPDVENAVSAATLRRVVRELADQAPAEQQDAVTRAAGVIGRTADGVLRGTLSEIAHAAGGDLAE